MNGLENITKEVATDLIELVNSLKGLEKSSQVEYSLKNKNREQQFCTPSASGCG